MCLCGLLTQQDQGRIHYGHLRLRHSPIDITTGLTSRRLQPMSDQVEIKAEQELALEKLSLELGSVSSQWKEHMTPQGQVYYYNIATHESSWVPPPSWSTEAPTAIATPAPTAQTEAPVFKGQDETSEEFCKGLANDMADGGGSNPDVIVGLSSPLCKSKFFSTVQIIDMDEEKQVQALGNPLGGGAPRPLLIVGDVGSN